MKATILCLFVLAIGVSALWTENAELRARTEEKTAVVPPTFSVNLDLPQSERWTTIGSKYKSESYKLVNYLRENLPKGWLKPIEKLAAKLMPFFKDYGEEMKSYADALGVSEGDIVMMNLVYQMEHLGVTCDNWNTTGPVDPDLCLRDKHSTKLFDLWKKRDEDGPGACTSFVASNSGGTVFHGRNLDWNLEDTLKQFVITVDYQKNGETLFTGSTMVGFVGVLHALKKGAFGWSMDARRKGGSIALNALEGFLKSGVRTPEQHARYVFENAADYDDAVKQLSDQRLVNDAYYIVSGPKYPQGTVLARNREHVAHRWDIVDTVAGEGNTWTGITNYDLNMPVPPSDDRRTPMVENLNALQGLDFGHEDIWNVLRTWPTMNQHTDIGTVMDIEGGVFDAVVYYDEPPSTSK